ncbi:MAG: carbohydrate ABC transporter permease [Oscillospiraceae bacterium]
MSKKTRMPSIKEGLAKYNRVGKPANALFTIIFIVAAFCCIIPLIFVVVISFTDQSSIYIKGYSLFPDQWSVKAYTALFHNPKSILMSFGTTIFITIVGTSIGLMLNATMGYVLSRKTFKYRKLYTYIVFIPMIFNGGMVANYIILTRVLNMKDTVWALILPIAVTSFYVIILRTFFTTTVPDSLIESGKIDGASQLRIFFQIVLPISLPALATIGLFLTFAYWNDWFQALLYVTNRPEIWPMQYTLIAIEKNLQFLANNPSMAGMAAAEVLKSLPPDGVRMALVVMTVVPIACSYPFFQKYFISGLTIGAVKG